MVDILPTILEAAGASYQTEVGGHEIQPMQGFSLMSLFEGKDWSREQPIFWEHEGNSAIRMGQFKLVRQHGQDWELYDMEADRTELNDLSGTNAKLETELKRRYRSWAEQTGVMDWNEALPKLLAAWQIETAEG